MKKYLLALLLLAFVLACSEGIYPDFLKDDDSSAATTEEMEIALNDRDYDKIIGKFEGAEAGLSDRQKYLLQGAYMGKAGFDPIENLDLLLDDSDVDPITALMGSQAMTKADALYGSELYRKAANIHLDYNNGYYVDEDIMLAGSVASALRLMTGAIGAGGAACAAVDFTNKATVDACLSATTIPQTMVDDAIDIMTDLVSDPNLDGKVKDKINEILTDMGNTSSSVITYLQSLFA